MTERIETPEVRLVVTVDLTGRYNDHREVAESFRAQTRRNIDCHTAIVQLGADAVRHHLELGKSIAGTFFLSAKRIEVHAPAGNVMGALIYDEVSRYVRLYTAAPERMTAPSGPAG